MTASTVLEVHLDTAQPVLALERLLALLRTRGYALRSLTLTGLRCRVEVSADADALRLLLPRLRRVPQLHAAALAATETA